MIAGQYESKSLAGDLLAVYEMDCLPLDLWRAEVLRRIRRKEGVLTTREIALVWRTYRRDFDLANSILMPCPFPFTGEITARRALGLSECLKSKAIVPNDLAEELRCPICRTGATFRCGTRAGKVWYACENQRCVKNNC